MVFTDVVVTFLIGALGGLGVGAGGLLIVYLTAGDGMGQFAAQALNLGAFVFALGAALLVHLQRGKVSLPVLCMVVLFGAAGAWLGSGIAVVTDAAVLRTSLGFLLLFMGGVALFRK